jgi:hypothetical protein
MPFEITPFMLYLTRETSGTPSEAPAGAVSPAPASQAAPNATQPGASFVLVPVKP